MGRPTNYSLEIAKKICDAIATSPYGLEKICEMNPDLPGQRTIFTWRNKHEEFEHLYARAKVKQSDLLAEECLNIAAKCDKNNWNQARLLIDTHKWLASKLLPKIYGDRISLEQKTEQTDQQKEEIKALRASLDAKNKKDY